MSDEELSLFELKFIPHKFTKLYIDNIRENRVNKLTKHENIKDVIIMII
jgi:hypothetical protein